VHEDNHVESNIPHTAQDPSRMASLAHVRAESEGCMY
jgi:hypothetical protein